MPSTDPGPLFLERRIEKGEDEFVRRVTATGEVWSRSHLVRQDEDGWPAEAGSPEWELEAQLPAPLLERLRTAVEDVGFFDLPAEVHPDGAVMGASDEVWSASVGGRDHAVRIHAAAATRVPAITQLTEALDMAMADASDQD